MLKTYSHWLLAGALGLLAAYLLALRWRRGRAAVRPTPGAEERR